MSPTNKKIVGGIVALLFVVSIVQSQSIVKIAKTMQANDSIAMMPAFENQEAASSASMDSVMPKAMATICVPSAAVKCGKITIVKDAIPNSYQDFNFSTNIPGYYAFPLDDDATLANPSSLPNSKTMFTPANGTWYVNEMPTSGYTTVLTCQDPTGGTTIVNNQATINIYNAELVTCTYKNTATTQPQACVSNTWTQKASFIGGREEAVGFSIGNKGYVGTGFGYPGWQVAPNPYNNNDFWEYNPVTNVWTQKANFGGDGRFAAVGFSIGNKGYIGTGSTNGTAAGLRNDFWEYNPLTNTWTQKANFGGTPRSNAVGFSIGNKGYIGTGAPWGMSTVDFWEYNPLTDTWTQKANFGGSTRFEAVGFSIGTKGYIGTGEHSSNGVVTGSVNDFWEYNPLTDTWTQKANFGGGSRYQATGFSIGTKGYIGTGAFGLTFYSDFWEYNPGTDTWTQKANVGTNIRLKAVGFSIGNKGYAGTGAHSGALSDFYEYCP